MGGFVGILDNSGNQGNLSAIKKMNLRIIHRGPSCEGYFADGTTALGVRRLGGSGDIPPFAYGSKVIAADCVIYNAAELSAELSGKGYPATTAGEEVILYGYTEYGADFLNRLRGTFSFAIWDTKTRELFAAKDYFGTKPFYYGFFGDAFIFGSEIKSFFEYPAFKKEADKSVLKNYLIFQYSPLEQTFFKGVKKLDSSHYLIYNANKKDLKKQRYFDFTISEAKGGEDEFRNGLEKTLKESIELHKRGVDSMGSFLSGGVDSSFLASAIKPAKTFSVGSTQDGFDESLLAGELSKMLGIENRRRIITGDEFFDILPTVQYHSDEPHANLSTVPLYFLAKLAAEEVGVTLSGEGSDEFFAGYLPYMQTGFTKAYKVLPLALRKKIYKSIKNMKNFKGKAVMLREGQSVEERHIGQAFIMDDAEANGILAESCRSDVKYTDITAPFYKKVQNYSDINKMMYLDMNLWMSGDILLKADKMAAAHSLEVRTPILDIEVWKYAASIPPKYKVKGRETKHIFRSVASKYIPEEWASRKKLGFPVPFTAWLYEDKNYNIVRSCFSEKFAAEFFETKKILKLLDDHHSKKVNNGRKIYTIYAFLIWYRRFFVEDSPE